MTEFAEFGFTIWMAFSDSDLKISHLSIEIPEQACIEPYDIVVETNPAGEVVFEGPFQDFFAMVVVTNRSEEDLAQPCGQSGEGGLYVLNVSAAAPFPDFLAPVFNPKGAFSAFLVSGTPASGCEVFDDLTGTVKVVDSCFTGVGNVLQAGAMVDSKIIVKRNVASPVDAAVIVVNSDRTLVNVHSNTFEVNGVGVIADNCSFSDAGPDCLEDTMTVKIHHNTINVSEIGFAGIGLFDGVLGPPNITAVVKKNDIVLNGAFTGVITEDIVGGKVVRNTFAGAGVFGVLAELATTESKIAHNDMLGFTAFEAGILLGEFTTNNRVTGNLGAVVVDLGMGNNVSSVAAAAPALALSTERPAIRWYRSWR